MELATLLLCVKIFFSRILDVSLGTMRTITVVKGKTGVAACLGFCEVLIWFLIAREALASAGGIWVGIAYAGGFAAGTYIGSKISNRLIRGKVEVQVVTSHRDDALVAAIREAGYAVSVVDVKESEFGQEKYMLFLEIDNKHQNQLKELINRNDPNAFIVIHETKLAYNGFFKQK